MISALQSYNFTFWLTDCLFIKKVQFGYQMMMVQ